MGRSKTTSEISCKFSIAEEILPITVRKTFIWSWTDKDIESIRKSKDVKIFRYVHIPK